MRLRTLRVLAVSVIAAQLAAAQIPATDDSYTASSSPGSNYGTQPSLSVIGPGVNSYIRFDLTALPARLTRSNISKATLRLNINGVTTSATFDVYLVTSSWTEGAITFSKPPTLDTKVASAVMITTSKRNFIDVDVTSAVQAWLNSPTPSPNYGIALVPSSGSSISVSFDSKENTSTSHDPELSASLISAGRPPRATRHSRHARTTRASGTTRYIGSSRSGRRDGTTRTERSRLQFQWGIRFRDCIRSVRRGHLQRFELCSKGIHQPWRSRARHKCELEFDGAAGGNRPARTKGRHGGSGRNSAQGPAGPQGPLEFRVAEDSTDCRSSRARQTSIQSRFSSVIPPATIFLRLRSSCTPRV